ncbi:MULTISPECIES: putative RiPP precursor [unclassified Mesorhizobium]|nr:MULTISPECIES: putative RiPP precursor [unclassified Mesorhizobium]RUZ58900.1 putative RiPP precursor [Mesorhizobium sp. M7A.F.Ca.US.003.02.2.1]RVA50980.1 putative RiPP precursor [Mesorhizobium sp. M7A.F.Ca.US.001.01.1.1]MBZ9889620.1 putative RiPP precursor [Mesorhizobium sp. BR1-1-3]RUY99998.1 putative RiPP precursor [Mesorhizobium sp. M7A.F.Ca.CA.001.12.2.1]RUZ17555.1 putative RiPP precursor [Mesorhizobium sp. M7A.F.Ca.US.007.01.2.1]
MKKIYVKPSFLKKDRLSAITALSGASIIISNGAAPL